MEREVFAVMKMSEKNVGSQSGNSVYRTDGDIFDTPHQPGHPPFPRIYHRKANHFV
jgi:hypothetical protein